MPYLVINVLLQAIGIYLLVSTPHSEAWGIPPRAILGLLLLTLSLVTGLIFSVLVFLFQKHNRTVCTLLSLGMFAIPLGLMILLLISGKLR